jgi:hypothetical protein
MPGSAFFARFINEILEENRLEDAMAVQGYSDHKLRLMMRDYYRACEYEVSALHTIAVENETGPVLLIPMVIRDKQLSYFGFPASPVYVNHLNEIERSTALEAACCKAIEYCFKTGNGLIIAMPSTHGPNHKMANWEMKLLQAGGRQMPNYRGYVTIAEAEAVVFSQMRKSYRSLVNWGRRQMQLTFVDSTNPDTHLFDKFRHFHLEVAGKVTRPMVSWDVMFNLVKKGNAILGLAYLNGDLVAGTFLFVQGSFALYGTGVYDRNRFEKPISHWPLVATIQHAKKFGAHLCDLGQVFPDLGVTEKERNIAFFKKGFTNTIINEAYWQLDSNVTEE